MWPHAHAHAHAPVPYDRPTTLLAQLTQNDQGQVEPSLYDTARLVALAPWLAGHRERLDFLCHRQNYDGSWGGPDGYEVVPTLSATSALLRELTRAPRQSPGTVPAARIAGAAARGLTALRRWLAPGRHAAAIPDTIGVELIVPALLEDLHQVAAGGQVAEPVSATASALRLPAGFDRRPLEAARARLAAGDLPRRAWACLELLGPAAVRAPFVRPAMGAVGCSAAATAAWLGGAAGPQASLNYLESLQRRGGGPVAGVSPITYFESAWVLNSLAAGAPPQVVPAPILDRLDSGLTSEGAPAAPGLPVDSDDTAAVLSALLRHGRMRSPDCLLGFRTDGYFRCFLDERNPSVSANAHVLEALALYLARDPAHGARLAAPAAMVAGWLRDHQHADGCWQDKWHASPYYATACCVLSLLLHDRVRAGEPVNRAVAWVQATQRADGSWGRWQGTVEETAYAVQILAWADRPDHLAAAISAGQRYLAAPQPAAQPPLWHAKDLYTPTAVVAAARLAALFAASRCAALR